MLRLIFMVAISSFAARAQPTIDLLFAIDDTYRAGSVTALRPNGTVVWRGEVKQAQKTAHLTGPVEGAHHAPRRVAARRREARQFLAPAWA